MQHVTNIYINQSDLQIFDLKMSKKASELVGKSIKGYKIIKSIGEGKFSQVFRAENQIKVPYAMKNIKIFDMADQKSRDKCLKQVQLMKPLDHPNIIKYVDSFIENNELFIVTQWAQKGDLKKLIKQHSADENPFDQQTIWEYMRQVASALKHMHEKKIMHRDLKPANIFISQDMSLKVGDLGLGRVFGSQTLQAYSKVGTPLYMSPELIQDSGYNFNADVWSLGCICYELCQLTSPFRNKQEKMSLLDLFDNITKYNYKPISSRYSPELSQVIKKMIVVDPNYRLSSEQVLQIAEKNLKGIKKPLLDPLIVMDDIYVKLNLLDYAQTFCKAAERKPINKFYFALEDHGSKQNDQLFYFLELTYWVMALCKPEKKKEKLAILSKTNIDWSTPQNACRKLLVDLGAAGVRMDEIDLQSVINGYGQSICYILNQVLNRQLIRMNFQFKEPLQTPENKTSEGNEFVEGNNNEQLRDQIEKQSESSESVQQQSQFEQSIFYNKKNNRKLGNEDLKLLQKIQEYGGEEQDNDMIMGKVDQKQWKTELLRVEKKLNDIGTEAKQSRKKAGFQNFQTIKISSSKITDLIRSLKPISTAFATKLDEELSTIKKSEQRIQYFFKGQGEQYATKNEQFKILSSKSMSLSHTLKEQVDILEKTEQKLQQINNKIQISTNQTENNKVSEIKKSIKNLREEIKQLEQKQGILQWQLRSLIMSHYRNETRKSSTYENIDNFDFEEK